MTIDEVIAIYKTDVKIAQALKITPGAVAMWRFRGYIPEGKQLKLEKLTKGKLRADTDT